MKKVLLIVALLIISTTVIFAAQPTKGVGVGIETGLPLFVGPAAQYNFGPAQVNLSLGYLRTFGFNFFALRVGGDYNFPTPFINSSWNADFYLSVGGTLDLIFGAGTAVGIGIPVTWSWHADKVPIKVFVKAGPEIFVTGGGMVEFVGSAGAMYYFEI